LAARGREASLRRDSGGDRPVVGRPSAST